MAIKPAFDVGHFHGLLKQWEKDGEMVAEFGEWDFIW